MGEKIVCVDEDGQSILDAMRGSYAGRRNGRTQGRRGEVIEEETSLTVAELCWIQCMFSRLLTERWNETTVERRHRGGRPADKKDELEGIEEGCGKKSWIWRVAGVGEVLE